MRNHTKRLALALFALTISLPASAGPALLFDVADGKILYAEDPDDQWHPASLTKIMTAYLTFEAIKDGKLALTSKISCSELANSQSPSKVGLPVGAEMTVEQGLQALIVKSANDVAVMLAEAVAGSLQAFVERMNTTAVRLGMTRTNFSNANGLPDQQQVTTARDLARLASAVLHDFPEHGQLWSMLEVRIGKHRLHTHNGLLTNYEGADGLKTGFICDSGFNVVASATRDGVRLIAVVLGEPTGHERSLRAASLLEHGFQTRAWLELFDAPTLATMPVAADAKGPTTMRQAVVSYACGTARRVAKAHKKKGPAGASDKGTPGAPRNKAAARKAAAPAVKAQ